METLTTSADGAVNSKLLPLGSYCLQEVSAPDGYLLDNAPYPFTLTAAGRQTPVVEVKVSAVNTYLPIRVTLHKQQEAIRVDETADEHDTLVHRDSSQARAVCSACSMQG